MHNAGQAHGSGPALRGVMSACDSVDSENDIDECSHIAHIHFAIGIHIGCILVGGDDAQNHVDEFGHIAHIHLAIAIYIAPQG